MAQEKNTTAGESKAKAEEAKPKRKIRTLDERIAELEARRVADAEKAKAKATSEFNTLVAQHEKATAKVKDLEVKLAVYAEEYGLVRPNAESPAVVGLDAED